MFILLLTGLKRIMRSKPFWITVLQVVGRLIA